jgi:hypothetical protein
LTCAEAPIYLNKAVVVRFRTFQIFLTARRFHWQPVAMELEKDLERANRRIEAACFMVTGIASVVAVQSNETRVEVGLTGWERMSGTAPRFLARPSYSAYR